ncbi:NifB/NifX family molybdenum-iron cluster-binding protein [Methanospirillum hungatei]|uniref:NifB/NifX family molybdenum-iron cluster-binding protein n=1 Tax=Methanospirillum hungatei TaxID=2203 RepID=UPI0026ED31B4|nr:NifB/NifX family molybdenum-iron cluster-binding protein [Methanospirillum hungatei]
MIVCIPSRGLTVDSQMDDRFGRAPYFAFFDTDTDSVRVEPNPHAGGSGGVGPMAVQFLVKNNVQILIAPRLGGNADEALKAASIRVIMQNPDVTVQTAYNTWKANPENAS